VIAAAVQARHENTGRLKAAAGAHRTGGKQRRTPRKLTTCAGASARVRSASIPTKLALIQTVRDPQHRLELPERNDLRRAHAVGGSEKCGGPDWRCARTSPWPRADPGGAPAHRAHDLEAPQVRAEQKRPAAARDRVVHQFLTLDRDREQVVALVHQIEAIENGRGKGIHLS